MRTLSRHVRYPWKCISSRFNYWKTVGSLKLSSSSTFRKRVKPYQMLLSDLKRWAARKSPKNFFHIFCNIQNSLNDSLIIKLCYWILQNGKGCYVVEHTHYCKRTVLTSNARPLIIFWWIDIQQEIAPFLSQYHITKDRC